MKSVTAELGQILFALCEEVKKKNSLTFRIPQMQRTSNITGTLNRLKMC